MKEPHDEGIANRIGPESCAAVREGGGEALTGVRAGQPWSREKEVIAPGADAVTGSGRPHRNRRYRKTGANLARSKTLRMHGNTLHGNPVTVWEQRWPRPRREAERRTPMTYGGGKSDTAVVPKTLPSKAAEPAAEAVEGSAGAEGKTLALPRPSRCHQTDIALPFGFTTAGERFVDGSGIQRSNGSRLSVVADLWFLVRRSSDRRPASRNVRPLPLVTASTVSSPRSAAGRESPGAPSRSTPWRARAASAPASLRCRIR
jgi:hypothetical protein